MVDRNTKIRSGQIGNDEVKPEDLQSTNSPSDNDVPSYDLSTGKFTWDAPAGGGGLTVVGTATLTAETTKTITGLSPGKIYKFVFTGTGGNGIVGIRFNSDTSTKYSWVYHGYTGTGLAGNDAQNTSFINCGNLQIGIGAMTQLSFDFWTAHDDDNHVFVKGAGYKDDATSAYNFVGAYDGGSNLSSITFVRIGGAGTFTGKITIYEMGDI